MVRKTVSVITAINSVSGRSARAAYFAFGLFLAQVFELLLLLGALFAPLGDVLLQLFIQLGGGGLLAVLPADRGGVRSAVLSSQTAHRGGL